MTTTSLYDGLQPSKQGDSRESYMSQISDAGRAGDEANKIRQRSCQGHAVQSSCSAGTRLSRLGKKKR